MEVEGCRGMWSNPSSHQLPNPANVPWELPAYSGDRAAGGGLPSQIVHAKPQKTLCFSPALPSTSVPCWCAEDQPRSWG